MSATVTNDAPKPAASSGVSNLVALATGAEDLAAKAEQSPALMSWLQTTFGGQIAAAEKNPLAQVAGFALGSLASHYGVAADPAQTLIAGAVVAILVGDLSQMFSAWRAKKTAAPAGPGA